MIVETKEHTPQKIMEVNNDLFFIHCYAFCICIPVIFYNAAIASVTGYFLITKIPESSDLNTTDAALIWLFAVLYSALLMASLFCLCTLVICVSVFDYVSSLLCCDSFKQSCFENNSENETEFELLPTHRKLI